MSEILHQATPKAPNIGYWVSRTLLVDMGYQLTVEHEDERRAAVVASGVQAETVCLRPLVLADCPALPVCLPAGRSAYVSTSINQNQHVNLLSGSRSHVPIIGPSAAALLQLTPTACNQ